LDQIQFLKLDESSAFWFADQVSVSALLNAEVQPCLPYKPKDPGFLHDGAEPVGLAYIFVSIVLLDVDEYSVHREGQKVLCTFVHHIPWREAPRPGWLGCCTHC
jgi:hypothetical protein